MKEKDKSIIDEHRERFIQRVSPARAITDSIVNSVQSLFAAVLYGENNDEPQGNKRDHKSNNQLNDIDILIKKITWDTTKRNYRKEFLRQIKLLQKQEISFDALSINNKPYFKRGDECKAAVSLFMYWHEKKYITGLMRDSRGRIDTCNTQIIIDTFDMGQNKNFGKRGLEEAFRRIKNDRNKINVFSELLDSK